MSKTTTLELLKPEELPEGCKLYALKEEITRRMNLAGAAIQRRNSLKVRVEENRQWLARANSDNATGAELMARKGEVELLEKTIESERFQVPDGEASHRGAERAFKEAYERYKGLVERLATLQQNDLRYEGNLARLERQEDIHRIERSISKLIDPQEA